MNTEPSLRDEEASPDAPEDPPSCSGPGDTIMYSLGFVKAR